MITVPLGVVYILLTTLITMIGWLIKESIALRGRMHRLEAREIFVSENLSGLYNRITSIENHLRPKQK